MKNCILIDFDGTITKDDTTKTLVFELLKLNFLKFPRVFYYIIMLKLVKNKTLKQNYKNCMISYLLYGLKINKLTKLLNLFSYKVKKNIRPFMIEIIKKNFKKGNVILVVTASPEITTKICLTDLPVHVVGTEFSYKSGMFDNFYKLPSCYGTNKIKYIQGWIKKNNLNLDFIEAWSDDLSDLEMMNVARKRFWINVNPSNKKLSEKNKNQDTFYHF